jgi:hypothetical protein
MATVGAASLHVGVGRIVDVAVGLGGTLGTAMGLISMSPAVFERLLVAAASSARVASIICTVTVTATSSSVAPGGSSPRVVGTVVVELCLESGDSG